MAFSSSFSKNDVWTVQNYSIDAKEVIGNGAYGIVYRAKNTRGNDVAAKAINANKHPRILGQHLHKFLELNHANIVKILTIDETKDRVWMFMEYCALGDLNDFFPNRKMLLDKKLDVMKQMANGLVYLHSNRIIHRDIKPGNVLVSCDSPVWVKLTDFDVSKFMNPEAETSVMSSNVGTVAFKAPEFFLRNEDGLIRYHKNVDVFASGLTFLAILQSTPATKLLVPQIETAKDNSEKHVPIGSLLIERVKYSVPELSIVLTGKNYEYSEAEYVTATRTRELIREMTHIKPEERLSANEVLQTIQIISQARNCFHTSTRKQHADSPVSTLCPTTPEFKPRGIEPFHLGVPQCNVEPRLPNPYSTYVRDDISDPEQGTMDLFPSVSQDRLQDFYQRNLAEFNRRDTLYLDQNNQQLNAKKHSVQQLEGYLNYGSNGQTSTVIPGAPQRPASLINVMAEPFVPSKQTLSQPSLFKDGLSVSKVMNYNSHV